MMFSSIPAYLDPANYWQQQPTHLTGSSSANPQLPPPPQLQPPAPQPHDGGSAGSIRPGSMADRAKMANIPMPEAALKCPRCESTNTKFCYFNNYSLSQPRHFCKTCRRYWTRGGSLRSVPVGGGCRRNKRTKASSSKSPVSNNHQTSGSNLVSSNNVQANILGLTPQFSSPHLMAPFGQLRDYGSSDVSSNYGAVSAPVGATNEINFQMGTSFLGGGGSGASLFASGGIPFLGGLDSSPGLYPFQGGFEVAGYGAEACWIRPKLSASMLTQMASVKMEDNQEPNLSRRFMGVP